MSSYLEDLIFHTSIKLTGPEKHIAWALSRYANQSTLDCYPTILLLKEDTGWSERLIRDVTKSLQNKRVFFIEKRGKKNYYFFNIYLLERAVKADKKIRSGPEEKIIINHQEHYQKIEAPAAAIQKKIPAAGSQIPAAGSQIPARRAAKYIINVISNIKEREEDLSPVDKKEKEEEKESSIFYSKAKNVINHLNAKTRSNFELTDPNLKYPLARLNGGYPLEVLIAVINNKVKEWGGSEKMKPNLTPKTLFGENFETKYAPQTTIKQIEQIKIGEESMQSKAEKETGAKHVSTIVAAPEVLENMNQEWPKRKFQPGFHASELKKLIHGEKTIEEVKVALGVHKQVDQVTQTVI